MQAFIEQRADPQILYQDGFYYFTASVPAFDRIILRKSPTLEGLRDAEEKTIWTRHETGVMSCNIWAPEIHAMDGKWYIYFAAAQTGADDKGVYDHRIYILENESSDPMQGAFVEKGQMQTGWESFALDSTTVVYEGHPYFIWAQRDYAIPGNSNLYIAKMKNALELELPAMRLSIPEYDWECQGFLVNEGPACLIHDGQLFLTYSGSATDERYAMGLLTLKKGGDPLRFEDWSKSREPVMTTEEANGLYGPGHNSFTKDEEGRDLLVFHARPYSGFHGDALSDPNRHCYIRTVRYDQNGMPVFRAP